MMRESGQEEGRKKVDEKNGKIEDVKDIVFVSFWASLDSRGSADRPSMRRHHHHRSPCSVVAALRLLIKW